MDTARYVTVVLLWVSLPPGLVYWLLIHPFARFWRRLGLAWTFGLVVPVCLAVGVGLYRARDLLAGRDLGASPALALLGLLFFAAGLALALVRSRQLTTAILAGLPELDPERHPPRLLTRGIYARVRNPRYLEMILGILGMALFANYLGGYAFLAGCLPAFHVLVRLEERELRQRFGAEYEDYCERVPRFLPTLRPR